MIIVMKKILILFFIASFFAVSCGGGRASVVENKTEITVSEKASVLVSEGADVKISLEYNKTFRQGDDVVINYSVSESVDSVSLYIQNIKIDVASDGQRWIIPTNKDTRVGNTSFKLVVYQGSSTTMSVGNYQMLPLGEIIEYKARAINTLKHNRSAYCQGLEFYKGKLYESSGEYGKSYVQAIEFPSMKVRNHSNIDSKLFAEGITFLNDKLYLLTWQENRCLVMDPNTLKVTAEFQYNTEGWGITNDGKNLYMSDGTKYIYIIDPVTFNQIDRLEVMLGDRPLTEINEMEWVEGEIWANVFTTDNIVRINPRSGAVVGIIDASDLLLKSDYDKNTNVLNGIAYDRDNKKIYLTGKNWPKLFEVIVRNEK